VVALFFKKIQEERDKQQGIAFDKKICIGSKGSQNHYKMKQNLQLHVLQLGLCIVQVCVDI